MIKCSGSVHIFTTWTPKLFKRSTPGKHKIVIIITELIKGVILYFFLTSWTTIGFLYGPLRNLRISDLMSAMRSPHFDL